MTAPVRDVYDDGLTLREARDRYFAANAFVQVVVSPVVLPIRALRSRLSGTGPARP